VSRTLASPRAQSRGSARRTTALHSVATSSSDRFSTVGPATAPALIGATAAGELPNAYEAQQA
jgi:hypothetical protein